MKSSAPCFKKRLQRFRKEFSSMGIEGFIIENPTDITYFTGLKLSRGRLLILEKKATLFVDGRYTEVAKKGSPYPVKELSSQALKEELKGATHFGFDTSLSVAAHRELKSSFTKKKLKGFDFPTQKVRAVKDKKELLLLKKSATLLQKGFLHIRKKLKEGVRECDIAREFEFYVKKEGAEALSFEPIVAFGPNSALPHHLSSTRKLKKGDLVLIDIGVVLNGYASDMTRSFFFGQGKKRLKEIHKTVLAAHKAALKECKAGTKVAKLDQAARNVMGKDEKLFVHALGHGIGLDVHEYPRVSDKVRDVKLEEGMVITIEPGLYIPGLGGVRHEDMVVITKTGHRRLT
ncbi:M24 family metallopeptidase [Candidatus Neptunochlamydia vexilliferae]|uniref:Xaa-Pro dipeptidase n=1 Tax=Candidatus Neptunichlamydia vexilliferae TaxID=1651774 RepID=A0ABS0B3E3_9BACT|nr:Xaa-Pro peptidase family protein [Candidatus Neptunochlamydia vexilliferae]MBF5060115.1 Xaa-Pro dipeptidase [Candidatus Neptunochlamydia vexilliferae]